MKKYLNLGIYKAIGFYFSIVAIILSVVAIIIYSSFDGVLSEYYSGNVMIPLLIGIILFVVLSIFKRTAKYASIFLWAMIFVTFLLYVDSVYMYFTGVFYSGINGEALKLIDSRVMSSLILIILACIIGNVSVYLKNTDKKTLEEK